MNVQDAVREFGDEIRRKQPHVARETDQIHFAFVEHSGDLTIINLALETLGRNYARGYAARLGAINPRRAFAIADDNCDFRVRDAARRYRFRQSLKIRAAAAQEHADALLHKRKTLAYWVGSTKSAGSKPRPENRNQGRNTTPCISMNRKSVQSRMQIIWDGQAKRESPMQSLVALVQGRGL